MERQPPCTDIYLMRYLSTNTMRKGRYLGIQKEARGNKHPDRCRRGLYRLYKYSTFINTTTRSLGAELLNTWSIPEKKPWEWIMLKTSVIVTCFPTSCCSLPRYICMYLGTYYRRCRWYLHVRYVPRYMSACELQPQPVHATSITNCLPMPV